MPDRIASVETFRVDYPVAGHFKFFARPSGLPPGRPTVVVKITSESGLVGWGQSVPSPRWSYETPETVRTTIDHYLAPEILGCEIETLPAVHAAMNAAIAPSFSTGQPVAKAAIDLALHDLIGKSRGCSLPIYWGCPTPLSSIELSWTLNPSSLTELEADMATAHHRGYRSFNLKVGPDPNVDAEMCRLMRRLAPDSFVWADANGGYSLDGARTSSRLLADLGFSALEQPLPANRLTGYRQLRRFGALPILMDEGVVSTVELEEFVLLELLDGIALKVARCGGLTESLRMARRAEELGLLRFASGLTDPDIALAACAQLFAAIGLQVPAALNGPQFLTTTILSSPLVVESGRLLVPPGVGLGIQVRVEVGGELAMTTE